MLNNKPIYSANEIKLFEAFGYSHLIDHLEPLPLYRMIALQAFKYRWERPAVEPLRRALNALEDGNLYRLTKEFDDLIKF